MKTYILSLLLSLCMSQFIMAQSSVVASGGTATGENGTVSFSIGQIDYNTVSGDGGTLTEGVQQPFEITIISGVNDAATDLEANVYPNPATHEIQLALDDISTTGYSYQLYDARANLIRNAMITEQVTAIPMQECVSGIYFLKVMDATSSRTFKINKINR